MNPPAQTAAVAFDESLVAHLRLMPKRPLLRVMEVAQLLDVSRQQIYELLDSGELEEHRMTRRRAVSTSLFGEGLNAQGKIAEEQRRACSRITRRSVVMYLARSAHYDLSAHEHIAAIGQVLRDLPNDALEAVRAECSRQLALRAAHA